MSYRALSWAWDIEGVKATPKFVLVALADMADEAHSCYPGQERIAEMAACSVDTVARAIKSLEQDGLLVRELRRRPDGYRTSDRYFLQVGRKPLPRKLPGEISPRNDTGSHPANSTDLTPQSAGVIPSKNTQVEHPVIPTPDLEQVYGEFRALWRSVGMWQAGPKVKAKLKVLLSAGALLDVFEGLQRLAQDPNRPEPTFVRRPLTWLNQEGWTDDPYPAPSDRQGAAERVMNIDLGQSHQGSPNGGQAAFIEGGQYSAVQLREIEATEAQGFWSVQAATNE